MIPKKSFLIPFIFCFIICTFALSCSQKSSNVQSEKKPGNAAASEPVAKTNPEMEPVSFFDPKGIQINYTADKMLNSYEDRSRTLMVVVYQLNNINAFNNLVKDESGISQLLENERFDTSVVGMDKLFIEPGRKDTIYLNRVENARWVAIVAGYCDSIPRQAHRIFEIPVIVEKKGVYGFRKTEARVVPLQVDLYFGTQALQLKSESEPET
ncbi:MAG: type VI secretion lipoprotein TssJ [Smithella sp.]